MLPLFHFIPTSLFRWPSSRLQIDFEFFHKLEIYTKHVSSSIENPKSVSWRAEMAKSKLAGMENRLKRHIAEKIRAARRARKLSQEELAARISRTAESISNIERAKTLPNIDTLIALSRALETPLRDLFPADGEYRKISAKRSRLENEAIEEIHVLPDQLLEIALRQIRALKSP